MLDPRIYRTGMIVAVMAVIVFAFSLQGQRAALSTNLAPDAFNGQNAFASMNGIARLYPDRRPGSEGDDELGSYVAAQFRQSDLEVATSAFRARTADGTRTLETVTGTSPGTSVSSIVIVAHRDAIGSPATAELSGTATLLGLANALEGETHSHAIVLASTSGSAGAAGAAQLAHSLHGPVDAVIALGDLAGPEVREPIVVPWSSAQALAPPMLRNTVAGALTAQTGLAPGSPGLDEQLAHLALPLSLGEQAPFGAAGYPAVLLSLSGAHEPGPREQVRGATRITALGQAVLQAINALDSGPPVPAASAYLTWNGNLIPAWAVRVLVLALLVPVLVTSVDGAARARRRGTAVTPWLVWVLGWALPFVLALAALLAIRFAGLISVLPAGPVGGGVEPLDRAGAAILIVIALVLVVGFAVLCPLIGRRAIGGGVRLIDAAGDAGAAAAIMIVICAATLTVWAGNPFAALLLVPAAHLWMWVLDPDLRMRPSLSIAALGIGLLPPVLEIVYCTVALGLTPIGELWNGALLLAGGQVAVLAAVEWSVVFGCALSVLVVVIGRRRMRERHQTSSAVVRSPGSYAAAGALRGVSSVHGSPQRRAASRTTR